MRPPTPYLFRCRHNGNWQWMVVNAEANDQGLGVPVSDVEAARLAEAGMPMVQPSEKQTENQQ